MAEALTPVTPIPFADADVNNAFEATISNDIEIEIKADKYKGPLSKIPLKVAQGMVQRGSNLIKPKAAKAVAAPAKEEKK